MVKRVNDYKVLYYVRLLATSFGSWLTVPSATIGIIVVKRVITRRHGSSKGQLWSLRSLACMVSCQPEVTDCCH